MSRVDVKLADLGDMDKVASVGEKAYVEYGHPGVFSADAFCLFWRSIVSSNLGAIILMFEEYRIVGGLGALKVSDPYTGDMVAHELFWYSAHKRNGIKLFRRFMEWAKEESCKRVYMTSVTGLGNDGVDKFYEKNGFKKLEFTYFKEVG